ncbi:MAG: Maleylpyruvate isomerase, mycothiol-dependent [uncultured Blastococcus sp.]|uniref:Maleylpyruvate isomerase, mycothiol-dependent n=1 Tax=uncultured Blastococcus sp. TaxID=217144 RepID=A0A6J4IHN2_9ACTN|nr:MAG: Maleylpyruvate isomerase, mycothiol-dependent [uncultured Blastococcus sp.]
MTDQQRQWWTDGEEVVGRAVQALTDEELAAAAAPPGWSRAHVVAHLSRNADALVNLLTWARTGVETPMYPSRAVRDADIDATAARPPAEIRADHAAARERLARAIAELPDEAWSAQVRNGQGVPVQASVVPFMRAKEVWAHGTDLRAGLSFADLPADFASALVDDVLGLFASRDQVLDVTVVATDVDRTWGSGGTRVEGPVSAIAAWLTRSDAAGLQGDVPPPPAWL